VTNTTVSRFQIVEANQLQLPHRCATCGAFSSDGGRKYVTFDLWVEFYGNVYICTYCFLGAAGELGCVPVAKYNEAMLQRDEFKSVVTTLIEENRGLRDAVDSLRTLDRPDPASYSYFDPTVAPVEVAPIADDPEPPKREDGPSEQIDVRRFEDIHNDDGALADSFTNIGLNLGI
jgi:hypothetical protein